MSKSIIAVLAGLSLCASLLCSCASSSFNGTTQIVQESWGTKTIYKDVSGRTVQIDKRGPDNKYLPGACMIRFTYNTNGARIAKQNLDSDGYPVCNTEGYAVAKYAYLADSADQPVVDEKFFDANNQPVVTKSGFATMTCTENPDGRVNTAHFSDFLSKPAPSVWFGVSNVVDVQYFYLQGVTPIVCGVFRDVHGNIIQRKQLKGLASQVVVSEDPTDDDDIDMSVDVDVGDDSSAHGYHGEDHGHR